MSLTTGLPVLAMSILALVAYGIIGAIVVYDATSRDVERPYVWGVAVFLAMFLGTLFVPRQLVGATVAGVFVISLYVLNARQ